MYNMLLHDSDFDNAIFFGYFVMVTTDENYSGGGLIEKYNESYVWISNRKFSRTYSSFLHTPPPEVPVFFSD